MQNFETSGRDKEKTWPRDMRKLLERKFSQIFYLKLIQNYTLQRRRFVSWPTFKTRSSGCGRARCVSPRLRSSQWRRGCPPPAPPWSWTAGRRPGAPGEEWTPRRADGDPGPGLRHNTSKINETTGREPADSEVPACRLETARRREGRRSEEQEELAVMPAWRRGEAWEVCRLCTSPSPPPAWWTMTMLGPLMEITREKHRK